MELEETKHGSNIYKEELKLKEGKETAENQKEIREAQAQLEVDKKKIQMRADKDKYSNEIAIQNVAESLKLNAAKFAT